jgi:hypothetical protein
MELINELPDNVIHKIHKIIYNDVINNISRLPKDQGNFDVFDHLEEYEKNSLQHMYNAITNNNLWEFMKLDPPRNIGYAFWNTPEIGIMSRDINVQLDGHSGASFAWVMRNMQYIAQHGWDEYVVMMSNN